MRGKIVFFTEAMNIIGGMERVVWFLSSEMALTHDVIVLTMNGGVREDVFNMPGVTIASLHIDVEPTSIFKKVIRYIQTIYKLRQFLASNRDVDFFVANSPAMSCCSIVTSFMVKSKTKYIAFEHNKFNFPGKLWQIVRKYTFRWFHKVISLTKDAHVEYMKIGCSSVCIPNAMVLEVGYSSELKNKKLIAVGRLVYQKGFDLLLLAWSIVHKAHPDWVLEIVGSRPDESSLKDLALKLDVANSVIFFGETKFIQERYQQSSGFIMSSRYEGFGLVLVEAMAHGLPCISFDCESGPSEIIKNNINGILVENDDVDALSKAIIRYIELGCDKKNVMSDFARETSRKYLPSDIIERWRNEVFNG